jgi:predicted nucleic acid-binding protein
VSSRKPAAPQAKTIVLDANILIRAVLGRRVRSLLHANAGRIGFVAPEVAFADAQAHLPHILARRGMPEEVVSAFLEQEILEQLPLVVTPVPEEVYRHREVEARRRLAGRDEDDWPFVALALELGCPVWTEDQDLFGSGVATWTTDRIEVYFEAEE